jgi:hypothetical protein
MTWLQLAVPTFCALLGAGPADLSWLVLPAVLAASAWTARGRLGRAALGRDALGCVGLLLCQLACMLAVLAAKPGDMIADDNQLGFPALVEMGRQIGRGELPLVSEYSWLAAGIAGEYGSAFFHPPLLAFAWAAARLPIPPHWLSLAWIEWCFAVMLTGTWALSRLRGLAVPQAFFAGCCLAANGYLFGIAPAWWVVVQSAAWLPWYWWALEQACGAAEWRKRVAASLLAAGILALLITAGWNFTALMAFVVHCVVVARFTASRRTLWPAVAGLVAGVIGLALSAPAWMMLLEYSTWGWRMVSREAISAADVFQLHPRDWLAAIYPFAGHHSGELQGQLLSLGTVPVVVVIAAACGSPRGLRRSMDLVVLAGLAVILCSLPDVPPFRWMFRFMPLLALATALLAATVGPDLIDRVRRRETGAVAGLALAGLACLGAAVAAAPTGRPGIDVRTGTLVWSALVAGAGWLLGTRRLDGRVVLPALGGIALAVTLAARLGGGLPWGIAFASPADWRERGCATQPTWYLANYGLDQLVATPRLAAFMPGNPGGLSGLRMINGYSLMQPYGPLAHFRIVGTGFVLDPKVLCHATRDGSGVLRRMAVDGLFLREDVEVNDPVVGDFDHVGSLAGFGVWHRRAGPSPLVQFQPLATVVPGLGEAAAAVPAAPPDECVVEGRGLHPPAHRRAFAPPRGLAVESQGPARVAVDIDTSGCEADTLVSFARPWLPGYRASLDGAPLAVLRMDLLMPAVIVPPDRRGRLELRYWPASLAQGISWCVIAGATAFAALGLTLLPTARRRHGGAAPDAPPDVTQS